MSAAQTLRARVVAEGPLLLPAVLLLAVVIAWAATGGGYEPQPALDARYDAGAWYLGALALLGLLWATFAGLGPVRLSPLVKVACAALAGYVAWSFLSMLWAHDRGTAFLGSDRALVYLAAFLTFAILPWRNWSARLALGVLAGGIGVIAVIVTIKVAVLADPSGLYIDQRLAYPLGYYNADAALFMTAAVLTLALGALRSTPAVLRVAGIVTSSLCLQLAVLSQSRGWLFTVPIVLALMLLLIPKRLRLLAFAVGPIAATVAVTPVLLRVYGRATPHGMALTQPRLSAVLHAQGSHAARAMLIADLVLAAIAALAVVVDRRVHLTRTTQRRIDRSAAAFVLAAALAGVAVGLVAVHGDPVGRAERAWRSFAQTGNTTGGYSHFTTLASHRADIWRVALHEFAREPLTGIGQDNFATSYTRLRRSDEQPRWAHSLELRLLTHTGLIGALLFVVFLTSALLAALRGRGRGSPERVTVGLLLLPLVVWLTQGSIDWFWEYPALSVPALAFTGAATALDRVCITASATSGETDGPRRAPLRIAVWLAAALLGAASLAALTVAFIAARHAQRATEVWPQQPARAYSELRSATDLLPFDAQLYLVGGAIALNMGELDGARAWLAKARSREDQNWLVPFSLGLIDSEQGHRERAARELRAARALDPSEAAIQQALARVHSRRPLTFTEAQALLSPHIVTPHA